MDISVHLPSHGVIVCQPGGVAIRTSTDPSVIFPLLKALVRPSNTLDIGSSHLKSKHLGSKFESIMAQPPEQSFLDLDPVAARDVTCGARTVEPWASLYHDTVIQRCYRDAIYARYNISGRSSNGTCIVDEILIDAADYHSEYPEIFMEALSFYSNSSSEDGRPEIIEAIRRIANWSQ